jgi:hypothetical protein
MSAPAIFTARFRWAILQQMRNEISDLDPLDPSFDELFAAILDAVWETASKLAGSGPPDPARIELFQVRNLTRRILRGTRRGKLPPEAEGGGP